MIFSERYAPAIRNGKLHVELLEATRQKLAAAMASHNHSVSLQRNPDDRWIDHSEVMSEAARDLEEHHPSVRFPDGDATVTDGRQRLVALIMDGSGENVLDTIEMIWSWLLVDRRDAFAANVNFLFESEEAPWRLVRGECIKLDEEFIGAANAQIALERLAAGPFAGAAAEYAKALREQASGETKDTIADACKSYESTLKVLTGLEHVNADRLVKALLAQGYLDDLPEDLRDGFRHTILMSLPFIRNRLAGHGQGAEVIDVPASYGMLALQLAAALQNFLIGKFLERQPPDAHTVYPKPWNGEALF